MVQAIRDDSVITPLRGGVQAPVAAGAAAERRRLADQTTAWFKANEVHFGVSVAGDMIQRPIPYDPLPRIVESVEWTWLERALAQRVRALDEFIRDPYGDARILRPGLVPPALVYGPPSWFPSVPGPPPLPPAPVCISQTHPSPLPRPSPVPE